MHVIFDVQHLYYLPQFLPVHEELLRRGARTSFVFYEALEDNDVLAAVLGMADFDYRVVEGAAGALKEYCTQRPDWVLFGNGFSRLKALPENTRSGLLYHGIGVKQCYYDADLTEMDVRFVEGEFRERELQSRFPNASLSVAGFAKLDPLFSGRIRPLDLAACGLDPGRPTLLYAPTYYPSSIERMPADLPVRLRDYNLLVKPHHFTFTKRRYRHQLHKLQQWQQHDNVWLSQLEDVSLLPMMASADLLISEASSALFEFAALDKPVVWCDFYYRRWNHRGPLRFRLDDRMDRTIEHYADIAAHAASPEDLPAVVAGELAQPARLSSVRMRYTQELIGSVDGRAAERVVDVLETARVERSTAAVR